MSKQYRVQGTVGWSVKVHKSGVDWLEGKELMFLLTWSEWDALVEKVNKFRCENCGPIDWKEVKDEMRML